MLDHHVAIALTTLAGVGAPVSRSCRTDLAFVIAKAEANDSGFCDRGTSGTKVVHGALTLPCVRAPTRRRRTVGDSSSSWHMTLGDLALGLMDFG
jgi:hypothetical protein